MKKFAWAMLVLGTVSLMFIALAPAASAQSKPVATPTACVAAPAPAAAGAPAAAAAAPAAAPAPTGRKKRVAIFDFDYATVQTSTSALFGTNVDVGKGVSDLLVKCLVQDGTYSVIERQQMDKILSEQNFSNSDRANPNSAAQIGKLLGVDAIIVGSVTQFGNDNKNVGVGGNGGGLPGFGIGSFGKKKSKAVVVLDARIVNIDTAEILGVAEGKGESERDGLMLGGEGGKWNGFGGGNVDFGSSGFQQTILGEAVSQAVNQMSAGIVADASKFSVRTISVNGLVAAVDGGQVILNVGGKAGVKVGDQLSIERVTREIKDPQTGAVIRRMTSPIGIVKVTDVDDQSSVCTPVSGTDFKVGDAAKTVTQ
jgi:curli biogenesis system outer membrane secretion channel CsgG